MENKKKIKKKNTNTSKNRNVKKTYDENSKKEIFGLLLMIIGIISFISLFSDNMGIIGVLIYNVLSIIGGSANFLLPLIFIFWGVLYNIRAARFHIKRYIICSIIIYISILILLDGSKDINMTLLDRINSSIEYLSITKSGGIVGAIFGFFIYKLLGDLGTYLVLSLIILLCTFIMIRTNIDQLIMFFEDLNELRDDKLKSYREKREAHLKSREKKKEIRERLKEAKEIKNKASGEQKTENIIIKDYTNDIDEEISSLDIIEKSVEEDKNSKENTEIIVEDIIKEDLEFNESHKNINYIYPEIALLNSNNKKSNLNNDEIITKGKIIESTMNNFGINAKVTAINRGPVITCYELKPDPGVKLSRIVSLSDNISMALASSDIRIEAPIPGKTVVGIEVPNKSKEPVLLRELIESNEFKNSKSNIPLSLGKDVEGNIIVSSIEDMPHMLIAGATGSGKSVCINGIITNIIYKSSPDEVKLMLIDPKVVELGVYNGIPHLLIPVVTNPKKAAFALNWAVEEMEKRYKLFAENSVRDLKGYNKKMTDKDEKDKILPKIVIIVDELADLMMVASSEIEDYIARLAQMARAAGMHLILATQRPSVDVITGTIKANIPSRIAFSVSSAVDSRTILDMSGAEKLLGKGDMLFYPSSYSKPKRIQGAFISDEEVERVVEFVKINNEEKLELQDEIVEKIEKKEEKILKDIDPLFNEAIDRIIEDEQASISYLQRKLKIGYSRAARIVDQLEEMGIIGPHEGSKPRVLLKTREEIKELMGDEYE